MLEFTLTEADLAAFAAHRAQESGEADRNRFRYAMGAAWLVGVGVYLAVSLGLTIPLLIAGQLTLAGVTEVVALVGGFAAGLSEWRSGRTADRLVARRYRSRARQSLAATGPERRMWLDATGLNVAVGDRSEHVDWAGISRVEESTGRVFVYTGPTSAHVIPAAGTDPEIGRLVAGIRAHLTR